mmetsp:Transcript_6903/g.8614  ORF Transcript_6903/g.8614 Transcript_6903/m.8614 type:complete len:89 (-) Transcript_6903:785-1051(-)
MRYETIRRLDDDKIHDSSFYSLVGGSDSVNKLHPKTYHGLFIDTAFPSPAGQYVMSPALPTAPNFCKSTTGDLFPTPLLAFNTVECTW